MSLNHEHVCILDDDSSVRKSLQHLLESDGICSRAFEFPEDFLTYARAQAVEVAVLDVVLPGTSGIEVHKLLREISPATRVIFISGRDDPSVRSAALKAGAFGFLSKPFDDEVLLEMVRGAVAA